ncbi:MAG: TetR/AcrR family transcriptional regulator [Pseudomonadota bacterium]
MSRRDDITRVATQAIQSGGLGSVSFRTLADAVGVKSASVHYHFPTKMDLAVAVVEGYAEDFRTQLKAIERQHSSVSGRVGGFIDLFEAVLDRDELCLCGMMAADAAALDAPTRRALADFFTDSQAWLTRQLKENKADCRLPLPSATLAEVLMSGLEGALLLDRVEDRRDRISAFRTLVSALWP